MGNENVWVCGCGLTGTPPFCDGSHAATRKEAPGALVHHPDNDDANAPIPIDPATFERVSARGAKEGPA